MASSSTNPLPAYQQDYRHFRNWFLTRLGQRGCLGISDGRPRHGFSMNEVRKSQHDIHDVYSNLWHDSDQALDLKEALHSHPNAIYAIRKIVGEGLGSLTQAEKNEGQYYQTLVHLALFLSLTIECSHVRSAESSRQSAPPVKMLMQDADLQAKDHELLHDLAIESERYDPFEETDESTLWYAPSLQSKSIPREVIERRVPIILTNLAGDAESCGTSGRASAKYTVIPLRSWDDDSQWRHRPAWEDFEEEEDAGDCDEVTFSAVKRMQLLIRNDLVQQEYVNTNALLLLV